MSVNSNRQNAVETLQGVLGVLEDGLLGPNTLDAIESYDNNESNLLDAFLDSRGGLVDDT